MLYQLYFIFIFLAFSLGIFLLICFVTLGVIFLCLTVYIIYAICCKDSDGTDSSDNLVNPNKRSNVSPKRPSTFKGHSAKGKMSSRSPKLAKTTGRRKVTPKGSTKILNRPTSSKNKVNPLPAYLSSMKELPSIKTDKDSAPRKEVTIRTLVGINPQQLISSSTRKSVSGTSDSKKAKHLAVSERSRKTRKSRQDNSTSIQRKLAMQNNLKNDIKMKSSVRKSKKVLPLQKPKSKLLNGDV